KGELAAAVGPSDHAEAAADAGDPRPHGHAFADEERRPGLRARAGAADLSAGPLLDAPVVERQLPVRREDVPELLRRELDDRRQGGGRGGDGERESSGEGGEGENETHMEQSTGAAIRYTSRRHVRARIHDMSVRGRPERPPKLRRRPPKRPL